MPPRTAIYLDANAGAPLSPRAREALLSLFSDSSSEALLTGGLPSLSRFPSLLFPNPSSSHSEGRRAKKYLNEARQCVSASFGKSVSSDQVIFTSSGTEANQMAIRAILEPKLLRGERPHLIVSAGEHEATWVMLRWLEKKGGTYSVLPLSPSGTPQIELLEACIRPETALISMIWVANETGVITDLSVLGRISALHGVPLHLDGAQAWGKIPLELTSTGAALVSFSGHKIGGLAGTGALWCSPSVGSIWSADSPLLPGKQEGLRRGGTENLLGVIALGFAASEVNPVQWAKTITPLREHLERLVKSQMDGVRIHGESSARVANTVNLGFEGVDKDGLVMALDLAGYCVSSGSACSSGVTEPSRTLLAMGLREGQARAAVRISLSTAHTTKEIEGFVVALQGAVARMRKNA